MPRGTKLTTFKKLGLVFNAFLALVLLGFFVYWRIQVLKTYVSQQGWASHQVVAVAGEVCGQFAGREKLSQGELSEFVDQLGANDQFSARKVHGPPVDPWEKPLSVSVIKKGSKYFVVVRSAGPDGMMGNGDDLECDKCFWTPPGVGSPQ